MVFNSPTKPAEVGRTDLTRHYTYGTPLRRSRKPSTPIVKSPSPLTFLSPSPTYPIKRKQEQGSPRISNIRNRVSRWRHHETTADQAKEVSEQLRIKLFDSPPQKIHHTTIKHCFMPEKISTTRGLKRTNSNAGDKNDLKIISTPYYPRSVLKRRKCNTMAISMEPLEEAYRKIDWWQEKMYKLQSQDWEYKRKFWIDQCHNSLWSVLKNPTLLELPGSEMFPKILLPVTQLTEADKHWLNVLVTSARVDSIKSPEFSELTHDPQNKMTSEEEFEFQIKFQFGFDIRDLEWCIHCGVGRLGLNHFICGLIAEFVGHSKFLCDVQIYYKKSATPWWEQDGIAKMKYYVNGGYVDMIDFSAEAEVYFVQEWPENNLVVDDYNELNLQLEVDIPEETSHMVMERKFISAVCCQIIHICICKTPAPKSCAARNVLKQVSMILKGWFIGVLLGEGLGQIKMSFEYDTRAPCLAPAPSIESSN